MNYLTCLAIGFMSTIGILTRNVLLNMLMYTDNRIVLSEV